MGEYYKRAQKEVILPSDSVSHYDFTEGFRSAQGQMLTLLVEADQKIEDLTRQLNEVKHIYQNFIKGLANE